MYDDEYMLKEADLKLYTSYFDKNPAPLYFKEVLASLQSVNPEVYESLVQQISADRQAALEQVFLECESR